ncbi:gallinacin-14-like [Eublepharis macularius]|uniref:Gallinacin-14-like n=1 Tax=Eublepharis macularius TaxID=481883 RepID=A0AA97K894_EUBMA|nr:gallinacin-14-like [Eublepharis macularius]
MCSDEVPSCCPRHISVSMRLLCLFLLVFLLFQPACLDKSGTERCRRLKGLCRHTLCHPVEVYVGRCNNGMGNCCVDDAEDIRKRSH